jgi:ParB/RepB/Spo0J family partition protein
MPKMIAPVSGNVDVESIAAAGIARKNDLPDVRKIDIAYIVDTGNVRKTYTDIEELAASIEKYGLLQPISVKALAPDDQGLPRYELVAGFRRWKAFQLLHDQNKGFAMIDAILVTGDKLVLQLIENLQRSDLSAREREQGIALICEGGVPKGDVAKLLSKSMSFVSRNIGAHEIRKTLDDAGINTSDIDTTIIYALHKIADSKYFLQDAAKQLIASGGTKSAAERIVSQIVPQYEAARKNPLTELAEIEDNDGNSTLGVDKLPITQSKGSLAEAEDDDGNSALEVEKPPLTQSKETKLSPKKSVARKSKPSMEDDFPETFPERLVRFDEVAKTILDYIERMEQDVKLYNIDANLHRLMAGKEILALLWKRLCNG